MSYIFPVFLSLIPALHLYINNRVPIQYAYPTWIVMAGFMLVLILAVQRGTRNPAKVGAIAGFFSIIFFYFEPFLQQLDVVCLNLGLIHSENYLLYSPYLAVGIFFLWTALWVVAARALIRSESLTKKVNSFLAVVSLVLLVMPLVRIVQIVSNSIRIEKSFRYSFEESGLFADGEEFSLTEVESNNQPDIFYLIFDGFAGEDILQSVYDMEISTFIGQLEMRGFYVASGSKTNYSQTINSLPSSLNMSYLDGLSQSVIDPYNWSPLAKVLQQNLVSLSLDELGYDLITFSSGFWPTEDLRTDKKYHPAISLNEYQEVLLQNTPLVHLYPGLLYDHHRNRITFTLDHLAGAALSEQPRFVFAHLYIPHPPFVFDEEGNHIHVPRLFTKYDADGYKLKGGTTPEYQMMYVDQLSYLLDQILMLVDEIFAETEKAPIIIIQGDHGPGSTITQHHLEKYNLDERFSIMNACYFPDQDYSTLYAGITPVNTFRVVFDQFFGTDLGLLADKYYFSTVFEPYNYTDMTEVLK